MTRELKGWVVTDVETTITPYMNRKASVFTDENWIVAAAMKTQDPKVWGDYWGAKQAGSRGYLKGILDAHWPRFLVGFNIKFDILWMTKYPEDYAAWQEWIAAGGELWDVQLAEYLLDGMVQESQMLSLDEVAPRYGGEVKIDEVKAMWAQGINTHLIPQQLLMDYLVGRTVDGVHQGGDILNTEIAFLGQLKAAKTRGQVRSIQLNNGALVATIEMERNGLFVNKEKGVAQAKVLAAEAEKLKEGLRQYLPADLPFEFNWGSGKQKSAFIFGGRVPYKQRVHQMDAEGRPAYSMKDEDHYELTDGTLTPVSQWHWQEDNRADAGNAPDRVFYGSGKKKGQPKTKKVKVPDYTRPKLKWEDFHYSFPGLTKPNPSWQGSEPGVYSTKADIIEELGLTTDIPFLKDFANLQAIVKDLGTYYLIEEHDEEGNVTKAKGMLRLVQPDGFVHHKLNMTSTVTARFSHADPNSGNLPRGDDGSAEGKHTSLVKEMFESRYQTTEAMGVTGGYIISSDFKSLEVYCQANLSLDKQLVSDLRANLDMHVARLSTVENKPYEELLLLAKGDKRQGIKAIDLWVTKRTLIKVFSFQRAYGAGAKKIASYLKVAVDLVEKWIEADDARYPGVVKFNELVEMTVANNRYPTKKFMMHPTAKVQINLGRSYYKTPDGKRYVFQESASPDFLAKKGTYQGFSPTERKNYPVQGLGGEWMKAAMWLAVRLFYKYKNFGGLALLINTVHDALYADAHESVARKAGAAVHASMLAASDLMEYWFNWKIAVPVPSETTYGRSMAEAEEFDDPDSFDATANAVRVWLRKTYMNNHVPSFL